MEKEIVLHGSEGSPFFTDDNTEVDSWSIESIYDPSTFKRIRMYIEDYEGEAPRYYTIINLNIVAGETEKKNSSLHTVTISFRDATKKEIQEYIVQK